MLRQSRRKPQHRKVAIPCLPTTSIPRWKKPSTSEVGKRDVPKRARICPECRSSLKGQTQASAHATASRPGERYHRTVEKRVIIECDGDQYYVKIGEVSEGAPGDAPFRVELPVHVNPCSVVSVAHVFRVIGRKAGIYITALEPEGGL